MWISVGAESAKEKGGKRTLKRMKRGVVGICHSGRSAGAHTERREGNDQVGKNMGTVGWRVKKGLACDITIPQAALLMSLLFSL